MALLASGKSSQDNKKWGDVNEGVYITIQPFRYCDRAKGQSSTVSVFIPDLLYCITLYDRTLFSHSLMNMPKLINQPSRDENYYELLGSENISTQ